MKISRERLKQIIKEELAYAVQEQGPAGVEMGRGDIVTRLKMLRRVWLPNWTDRNIEEDLENALSDIMTFAAAHWKSVVSRGMIPSEETKKIETAYSELNDVEERHASGRGLRTADKDLTDYVPKNKSMEELVVTGLGRRLGLKAADRTSIPDYEEDDL